ncbi:MAG: RsmE family RNA methyltransferase [Bacteroidia bacterium]
MKIFYTAALEETTQKITLDAEESQHAVKVLRCFEGENITLLNGKGLVADAKIARPNVKACEISIHNIRLQPKPSAEIHIALANLKKRDRVEWFIEKSVELGASSVILFRGDHTEKLTIDAERLKKIAISALKQSGNAWLPDLHIYQSLKMLLAETDIKNKFIAHCETDQTQLLKYSYTKGEDALVLIGPEGDFSDNEIKLALDNNYVPVNLGPLRLRAETAALTALLTLQVVNM